MYDDYDTTNCFIEYYKIFDIKSSDKIDNISINIINEITKDDEYNSYDTTKKDIKKLLNNGISGLNILDFRHVASIDLRYCHYSEIGKNPKWYLLRIWRN